MSNKMKIIPVFVPHIGCPNDCVFCNQKRITGMGTVSANAEYVRSIVEEYRKTIDEHTYTELAFFGGSFTAIDLRVQEELLKVGKHYKDLGVVKSIRCSTRPDAITPDILELQKKYGMDIIELGIQSLDDEVLKLSNRGHTSEDSVKASALIKEYGFVLGHQIMPGLPGSSSDKDKRTGVDSIAMKPDMVRIYPTLTIKDTALLDMYREGIYKPLTVKEAVEISAYLYSNYSVNNIDVIRIGLQNTDSINEGEDVVAGPFHPAFRQLVEEQLYLSSIIPILEGCNLNGKDITVAANKKLVSSIAGQKKANIRILKERYGISSVRFKNSEDDNLIEIYADKRKLGSFEKKDIFKNYLAHRG
ncbi:MULTISPECIES: elongator complex protein 3 [unclassified Sedimentibacter]|uniref:elongator complex protein 3 n=1 Tax=unclassified Sedimentibacter TaxID=2649220 RepID=UPI0027E0D212|nr:radical SAM protein [Sedimentibacter sp. MB35-C1]WMJ76297.1 radical SAM protein [Sedimentibacter sp. MB35-C1]